jgi:hypothetical protein
VIVIDPVDLGRETDRAGLCLAGITVELVRITLPIETIDADIRDIADRKICMQCLREREGIRSGVSRRQ